ERPDALDREPHLHERQLQQLADVGLVVDDEDPRPARARAPVALHRGACRMTIRKWAPGVSCTYSSVAPFAQQSSLARERPRPDPLLSAVKNGSKSWPRTPGGTPSPAARPASATPPP